MCLSVSLPTPTCRRDPFRNVAVEVDGLRVVVPSSNRGVYSIGTLLVAPFGERPHEGSHVRCLRASDEDGASERTETKGVTPARGERGGGGSERTEEKNEQRRRVERSIAVWWGDIRRQGFCTQGRGKGEGCGKLTSQSSIGSQSLFPRTLS